MGVAKSQGAGSSVLPCVLLAAAAILASCAHTYDTSRSLRGERLSTGASFYVAQPEPGSFGAHLYTESGRQTAASIEAALRGFARRIETGTAPEDYQGALESARERALDYAIVPVIEHWEERATEWSGKPDRIRIRINVLEVASGQAIDSAQISSKSRWGTLGGDHPQELLPQPVGDYIASLFE